MSSRATKHDRLVSEAKERAKHLVAKHVQNWSRSRREDCRRAIVDARKFLESALAPPEEDFDRHYRGKPEDPFAKRSERRIIRCALDQISPEWVDFFADYESYPASVESEAHRVPKRYRNRLKRVIDDSGVEPSLFAKSIKAFVAFVARTKKAHPVPERLEDVTDVREFRSQERMILSALMSLTPDTTDFDAAADQIIFNDVCLDRHLLTDARPPAPVDPPALGPFPPAESSFSAALIDCDWEHVGDQTLMFLYAREVCGRSVLVTVPFEDYFYVKITKDTPEEVILDKLRSAANNIHIDKWSRGPKSLKSLESTEYIIRTQRVEDHRTVYGFMPYDQSFLKVFVRSPEVCSKLRKILETEEALDLFEIHTDPITKFMVANKLEGTGYFSVENARENDAEPLSTCEREVRAATVVAVPDGTHVYEPVVMYYDIETLSYDLDTFPKPEHCPCFQISYVVRRGDEEVGKGVICMRETPGHEWYHHESQVLVRFAQLVRAYDPDSFVGYYSNNFDMPYILTRMSILGLDSFAAAISRRRDYRMRYRVVTIMSKQKGAQDKYKYDVPGRCFVDMALQVRDDGGTRLTSYKLKDVCAHFLPKGENKVELHYDKFPELFKTAAGRKELADYCLQDSVILPALDDAAKLTARVWAMARVIGTVPSNIVERGNTMLLMIKLKSYTERGKYLIPTFKRKEVPDDDEELKGGYVFEPVPGMYYDPVVVLDFKSLYPSIMMGWNLCYTTILLPGVTDYWKEENRDKYEVFENVPFVKSSTRRGIVPVIEEDTGNERTRYKNLMKKEEKTNGKGSVLYGVYDAMQKAYKVIMNSLYGMLAASIAQIPCKAIARVITGLGRLSLKQSEDYVNLNYEKITGRRGGRVIYGDTDSIFVVMPDVPLEEAIGHGMLLDKCIQRDLFASRPPMEMEYEKTFCWFVIIKAKAYAGAMYEKRPTNPERKETGLGSVRFDKARMCHTMLNNYLQTVLIDRDPQGALEHVRATFRGVMEDTLPVEEYAIIGKINKRPGMYKGTPPPVTRSWMRMVERVGPNVAPAVGDNYTFFLEEGHKEKAASMQDELLVRNAIRREGVFRFDKKSYLDTYVINPVRDLIRVINGAEACAEVLNYANYDRVDHLPFREGTMVGFFGKKGMKHVRKADAGKKDTYSFDVSKVKRARKLSPSHGSAKLGVFFKSKK